MTSLTAIPRHLRLRLSRRLRTISAGTRTVIICIIGLVLIFMTTTSSPPLLFGGSGHVGVEHGHLRDVTRVHRLATDQEKVKLDVTPNPIGAAQLTSQLELLANENVGRQQSVNPASQQVPVCSSDELKPPPADLVEPMRWQRTSESNDNVYVFSAHLDLRYDPLPAIVIIGISTEYVGHPVPTKRYCRLWYRRTGSGGDDVISSHVTMAHTRYSFESHGRRQVVIVALCYFFCLF